MIHEAIQEQTEKVGAEGAASTHTYLLNLGLIGCASHIHGEISIGVQMSLSRQHIGADPNGLQLLPDKVMLDSVIGFLGVHKRGIRGAFEDASYVNEMAQGKQAMDGRLHGPEACLAQVTQLMFLRPPQQPAVDGMMTSG